MTTVTVRDMTRDEVVAEGEVDHDVIPLEGCFYFGPDQVNQANLVVTQRIYTCPYKGICYWIDLVDASGRVFRDVAWVYTQPRPGYEYIKDKIGFAFGMRPGVSVARS